MRQKDDRKIYFLLNHQNSHVRLHFYKPMHDFLTGQTFTGNYDLPSHGVLVLDETIPVKDPNAQPETSSEPRAEPEEVTTEASTAPAEPNPVRVANPATIPA